MNFRCTFKNIFVIIGATSIINSCSKPPLICEIAWEKKYGGMNEEEGYSIQRSIDGCYIIAGSTSSFGAGAFDAYLIKTNESGDTIWTKTYGCLNNEWANCVQQTLDGGYIIVGGTSTASTGIDAYIVKTDVNGQMQWQQIQGGYSTDYGNDVVQTNDGGFIIVGTTYSYNNGLYIMKTDRDGNVLWTKLLGELMGEAYSIKQTIDGNYIITGTTGYSGATEIYLLKINPSGDTLWSKTYGGGGWDWGRSVAVTSDGGFVITGETGYREAIIFKTDSYGVIEWTKMYGWGEHGETEGRHILQTSDGGFIMVAITCTFHAGWHRKTLIIKTDSKGEIEWTESYGNEYEEYGYAVAQANDGGYVVVGTCWSYDTESEDIFLIKLELAD